MNGADHKHHLQELDGFFSNPDICRASFRMLIHFAIRLAAVGHTAEVLAIVQRSADADLFQPLADGLRLHMGLSMQATGPARKLALQIASKIADEVAAHRDAPLTRLAGAKA
ncbi:MAG: hypothetical protein K0R17_1195 [Rariglobus sp.]|jgi:hypothetical protein|nr:hypothetical protein [Rariglobus sp.]